MSKDPFKRKVVPRDPAANIIEHGVHGSRESAPVLLPSRRLLTIPIESIRPGRYQKRETIDDEKYQQLKSQIQELGLNFVAVLCADPDDASFYNPMMGGHLRIQAARELGIPEVSAIIREHDQEALAKGTYMENTGRQQLTLIDEGHLFKECQQSLGWTQEEIAAKLLVPGGRSHVSLCLLTVTAPPDIQEMLRKDPRRGQRCFYYLRQLDVLGEEQAIKSRAPIIEDFLLGKISTDEVQILVKQILDQGKEISLDTVRRENKISSITKSFQRFEKAIGKEVLSEAEREKFLKLREKIDELLGRN